MLFWCRSAICLIRSWWLLLQPHLCSSLFLTIFLLLMDFSSGLWSDLRLLFSFTLTSSEKFLTAIYRLKNESLKIKVPIKEIFTGILLYYLYYGLRTLRSPFSVFKVKKRSCCSSRLSIYFCNSLPLKCLRWIYKCNTKYKSS